MLADRANRDAALDALLPKRLRKTYHGTFRKSHLACTLFIIKMGNHKWPGTDRYITADQANAASRETLREGMWCKTWLHEDVYADLDTFKLLMASDNWEADEQMGDDELSVINRLCECMATVQKEMGVAKDQAVIKTVKKMCSTVWIDTELYALLDYAKTSTTKRL